MDPFDFGGDLDKRVDPGFFLSLSMHDARLGGGMQSLNALLVFIYLFF